MYRLHEWEILYLSDRLVLQEGEESLTESESACRRHAVFEHFDEVPLWHHRFVITCREELLLEFEPRTLVERIVELGESITYFAACDDRLEPFYFSWKSLRRFRERRDNLWMIHEEYRSSDRLSYVLPEGIRETLAVVSLVLDSEFGELCAHLIVSGG
jgi:hypothetical protein